MNKTKILLVAGSLFAAQSAFADTVYFNNGDVVSGTITKITATNVHFKPTFGADAEIVLNQADLKSFNTSSPITVETKNDTIISGLVSSNANGFQVKNDLVATPKTVALSNLKEAYTGTAEERHGLKTSGFVRGGLNIVSGNSDTKDYDLVGRFVGETGKSRITLNGEYGYSQDNAATTRDRTFGGIKYDYFAADKIYTFVNADFERDKFQELNLRSALGAGLGYQFYKSDDHNLNIELGPNFVNEDFEDSTRDSNYAAARWALNYDQKITDSLSVYHNHRIIQSLEASENIIANARTGFNVPIFDSVQAGFEWRLDWNNNPLSGNDSLDQGYVATVGYFF